MIEQYQVHNRFIQGLSAFEDADPHLFALSQLKYQYDFEWWKKLDINHPGIYILTGGRQVGKSTSCKLLIKDCIAKKRFPAKNIFYFPCDEVYNAQQFSQTIRTFLDDVGDEKFLLIVDEVTYVRDWDRVIKSLGDEGHFRKGVCLLTGSDTVILKEAAMRFPGRRGEADVADFHLYPLTFKKYVNLIEKGKSVSIDNLSKLFEKFMQCGGYLRAINDLEAYGEIKAATYLAYEQWIRGDFNKRGKRDDYLINIMSALLIIGATPTSYTHITQKIGLLAKDTCIDYCHLLERMDILLTLQAFDQNNKRGFPRKNRKFHFLDPFIFRVIYRWASREGHLNHLNLENTIVEAIVASHCRRSKNVFYFHGQGEIDVITLSQKIIEAFEVKWANQIRPNDLKMLKQFKNSTILVKKQVYGKIENINCVPVYQYLYELD